MTILLLMTIFTVVFLGNGGKQGKGESFGKYGKNAVMFYNLLILSRLMILVSYCIRSQIVYYRYLLYTFVKVHTANVESSVDALWAPHATQA